MIENFMFFLFVHVFKARWVKHDTTGGLGFKIMGTVCSYYKDQIPIVHGPSVSNRLFVGVSHKEFGHLIYPVAKEQSHEIRRKNINNIHSRHSVSVSHPMC